NYSPGCGLSELKYSARDCQTLEKIFRDEIKPVPSESEFLVFHDDDSSSLPTRDKILETWKHIQVQSNDTVIFYFSGHGKLDENDRTVLCLRDTDATQVADTGLVLQNWLDQLANFNCKHKIALIDACHSGNVELPSKNGYVALLSCQPEQQFFQYSHIGNSIFSYYLIRGLREVISDFPDPDISVDGIFSYLRNWLIYYQKQLHGRYSWVCHPEQVTLEEEKVLSNQQKPLFKGSQDEMISFGKRKTASSFSHQEVRSAMIIGEIPQWENFLRKFEFEKQEKPPVGEIISGVEKFLQRK
ncbi:MAG: hypothetical protein BRC47_05060, partial [Cyanobacteria bacterium QS_7_48_42]